MTVPDKEIDKRDLLDWRNQKGGGRSAWGLGWGRVGQGTSSSTCKFMSLQRSTLEVCRQTTARMADEDPELPLNLAQNNNLVFYISRNHSLATRVDDVLFFLFC